MHNLLMRNVLRTMSVMGLTVVMLTLPAAAFSSNFIVALNPKPSGLGLSSGTLPGTSPSSSLRIVDSQDPPVPLWLERHWPEVDVSQIKKDKKLFTENLTAEKVIRKVFDVGDKHDFFVSDEDDDEPRRVTATTARIGQHSYIFVDDALTMPDTALDLYVNEFEIMYDVVSKNIGVFSDRDRNGKVSILI